MIRLLLRPHIVTDACPGQERTRDSTRDSSHPVTDANGQMGDVRPAGGASMHGAHSGENPSTHIMDPLWNNQYAVLADGVESSDSLD